MAFQASSESGRPPARRSAAVMRSGSPGASTVVAGRVLDEDDNPIAGVTVTVLPNLAQGTTDADGRFSIPIVGIESNAGGFVVNVETFLSDKLHISTTGGLEPVWGGVTDAGNLILDNDFFEWVADQDGDRGPDREQDLPRGAVAPGQKGHRQDHRHHAQVLKHQDPDRQAAVRRVQLAARR